MNLPMQGVDLTPGIVAAVPGWDSVRLLAPHAELKLLACSQPTLIDAYRLRCACRCPPFACFCMHAVDLVPHQQISACACIDIMTLRKDASLQMLEDGPFPAQQAVLQQIILADC